MPQRTPRDTESIELRVAGCELRVTGGGRGVGGGAFDTSTRSATLPPSLKLRRAGKAQYKQVPLWDRQDKFWVWQIFLAAYNVIPKKVLWKIVIARSFGDEAISIERERLPRQPPVGSQ